MAAGPGPREPELAAPHRAAGRLRVRGGRPLHRLDALDAPRYHPQGQQAEGIQKQAFNRGLLGSYDHMVIVLNISGEGQGVSVPRVVSFVG